MKRQALTALFITTLAFATDAQAQDTGAAHFNRPKWPNLVDAVKTVGTVYTADADALRPEETYELIGHDLPREGILYAKLGGQFPNNGNAVPILVKKPSATSWTITLPDITGAHYQPWTTLRLYRDDKLISETTVKFQPRMEKRTFVPYTMPSDHAWASCSPNTNKDECKSFLFGSHMSVTHFAPTGTDTFYFKLKPGWRATRISSFSCSGISAKCVTGLYADHVSVTWSMPTVANLYYGGALEIEGPAGTDFR